jgi:hypothetical protein
MYVLLCRGVKLCVRLYSKNSDWSVFVKRAKNIKMSTMPWGSVGVTPLAHSPTTLFSSKWSRCPLNRRLCRPRVGLDNLQSRIVRCSCPRNSLVVHPPACGQVGLSVEWDTECHRENPNTSETKIVRRMQKITKWRTPPNVIIVMKLRSVRWEHVGRQNAHIVLVWDGNM